VTAAMAESLVEWASGDLALLPKKELDASDSDFANGEILEERNHNHAEFTLVCVFCSLGMVDVEHHVLHPRLGEQHEWRELAVSASPLPPARSRATRSALMVA
jgi:hypothetical protein